LFDTNRNFFEPNRKPEVVEREISLTDLLTFKLLRMETATMPVSGVKISSTELIDRVTNIAPVLSQHVEEEEKNGRLSPEVVGVLREAGFFKLFLPRSVGGLEMDPLTTAKIV